MALDTSLYDPLVAKHALMGFARSEAFLDWLDGAAWQINVAEASLTVADRGAFSIRVLGTYSLESKTFLWSWANAAITADKPKAYATTLRDNAARGHGLTPFTERKLAASWVGHEELVAVVSDLAGLPPFEATYGDGVACILVEGAPEPTGVDVFLAKKTIDRAIRAIMVNDAPGLVISFLNQTGFAVKRPEPTRIEATKGDDGLTVVWTHGFDRYPTIQLV